MYQSDTPRERQPYHRELRDLPVPFRLQVALHADQQRHPRVVVVLVVAVQVAFVKSNLSNQDITFQVQGLKPDAFKL
jgi:hypothetical protein